MRLYLDSSAFAKYYGNVEFEKGTIQFNKIIDQVKGGRHTVFSSYWLIPEVASTIDSWARKKFISKHDKKLLHTRLVTDLLDWLQNGYLVLVGIKYESYLRKDFLQLIMDEGLSPGDTLHIYTALLVEPDYFITADTRQIEVVNSLGMVSFNPEKELWK